MKIGKYLGERKLSILFLTVLCVIAVSLGNLFNVNKYYMAIILFLLVIGKVIEIIYDVSVKKSYYDKMEMTMENLDQKYLIYEMLEEPTFYEAEILNEALYTAGKSMKEKINQSEETENEFKDYLEMWIHDIKIPISALQLMNYNENMDPAKQRSVINQINYYVENILFLTRADVSEKDYLMKRTNLETMINKVVVAHKETLIAKKVSIQKEDVDAYISTDSKWMEYILSQIVSNSVKYFSDDRTPQIKFFVKKDGSDTVLSIEDNGIGIPAEDIPRLFEKSFTGKNGRCGKSSTGIGLYICEKLCKKMGHVISVESEVGKYTRVNIRFGSNGYIEVV